MDTSMERQVVASTIALINATDSVEGLLRRNPSRNTLFHLLFGTSDFEDHRLFSAGPAEIICGTTWGKGGIAFRCVDCEKDHNCVVCAECYFDSEPKHANHRVKLIRTTGGCCDCGDVSSWNETGFCSRHGPTATVATQEDALSDEEIRTLYVNAEAMFPWVVETVTAAITSNVDKTVAAVGLEFLLECAKISSQVFRPVLFRHLPAEVVSVWIQVCCVLAGRNPRPRPPVLSVPSREDCGDISESLTDFFLALVQLDAGFKIDFTRTFLSHYGEIVKFKGDFEDTSRGDLGSLSVQLFTIPEVCEALLQPCPDHSHPGLLTVLLENLNVLVAACKDPATGKWTVRDMRPDIDLTLWRLVHDLGYCLHHDAVCAYLLADRQLLELLIAIVKPLEHANVQSVKHGDHVLYENVVWRALFHTEQLLLKSMAPMFEFARKNDPGLLVTVIVANMEPFDVLRFAGENASFHTPLARIIALSIDLHRLPAKALPDWMVTVFSPSVLRQLLLEALRPLSFADEIANDVWVRNGDTMRFQAKEFEQSIPSLLTLVDIAVVVMARTGMDAMAELMRAFILLIADVPDDTTNEHTVLSERIKRFSSDAFGPDQIDDWLQLLLRDVLIGGNGNPTDKRRRRTLLGFVVQILCVITTDNSFADLAQLDTKEINEETRKGLISRCLVQLMPNQRLSYSQILSSLPSVLRHPESLVDAVVGRICIRDRSAGSAADAAASSAFKLSPEGLKSFDVSHRTFRPQVADLHAIEEYGVKHTSLLGLKMKKQGVLEAVITALSADGFFLRFISSLLRVRLCEQHCAGCLDGPSTPAPEMPPSQLDTLLPNVLKIVDNVAASRGGVNVLRTLSEASSVWKRPMFAILMRLDGLVQRKDLNGLSGVFFGKQDGRNCVTMAEHGKLLAKDSNSEPIDAFPDSVMYAESVLKLVEELADIPKAGITEVCRKLATGLVERMVEATGVVSSRASPVPAAVVPDDAARKSEVAKKRQALLLQRMRSKQFSFDTAEAEEAVTAGSDHECAMCREAGSEDDPIVAIGHCVAGNALARKAPFGHSLATPAAPYLNACLHTVHVSCWQSHVDATSENRGATGLGNFLTRPDVGEFQCPVCRSLANVVIPVLEKEAAAASEEAFEDILNLGDALLNAVRPEDSGDLWLSRAVACWRPFLFSSFMDALSEVTYNEILLSTALTPNKVLAPFSLYALLVRCMRAAASRDDNNKASWEVWSQSTKEAERVDCARLFLEAARYDDREFAKSMLALRHLQLVQADAEIAEYQREMAHLAVLMAWIVAAVTSLSAADTNRIAFLPEDAAGRLSVVEQVLNVADWQTRVTEIESKLGWAGRIQPAPHPHGGLVDFTPLPEKLTDVIRTTLARECENCHTRPQDPAICLLCGAMVCLDADCCKGESGEGECTTHAATCGAGQGVFFLPFASIVVAVAAPRNCIWDGPYEDNHGEPDSYLKRSCKLNLSHHRLDQMRLWYTRGSIPIEIVRQNQVTGRYVPRQL